MSALQSSFVGVLLSATMVLPAAGQASNDPGQERLHALAQGRTVQFNAPGPVDSIQVTGELLAADPSAMWVQLPDESLGEFPLASVSRLRAERHGFGGGKWLLVAGGLTTIGMTVACASYEDADGCANVLAVSVGLWGLFGGFSALAIGSSRWERLTPDADALRAYARYPQGLPPGMRQRR